VEAAIGKNKAPIIKEVVGKKRAKKADRGPFQTVSFRGFSSFNSI
jgi:hypothetical protein